MAVQSLPVPKLLEEHYDGNSHPGKNMVQDLATTTSSIRCGGALAVLKCMQAVEIPFPPPSPLFTAAEGFVEATIGIAQ